MFLQHPLHLRLEAYDDNGVGMAVRIALISVRMALLGVNEAFDRLLFDLFFLLLLPPLHPQLVFRFVLASTWRLNGVEIALK